MNEDTQGQIGIKSDKQIIKADGKSLAYVTIDLKDNHNNLITDFDAQKQIDVT